LAINQLPVEDRAEPLAQLLGSSDQLLRSQGLALFNQAFASIENLLPQHREAPLDELMLNVACLEEGDMLAACNKALDMLSTLPRQDRVDILHRVLSNVIEHLPSEDQAPLFHAVLREAAEFPEILRVLCGEIQHLDSEDQLPAFNAVLNVIRASPRAFREELLNDLEASLQDLTIAEVAQAKQAIEEARTP
jgi:hypothetical protein